MFRKDVKSSRWSTPTSRKSPARDALGLGALKKDPEKPKESPKTQAGTTPKAEASTSGAIRKSPALQSDSKPTTSRIQPPLNKTVEAAKAQEEIVKKISSIPEEDENAEQASQASGSSQKKSIEREYDETQAAFDEIRVCEGVSERNVVKVEVVNIVEEEDEEEIASLSDTCDENYKYTIRYFGCALFMLFGAFISVVVSFLGYYLKHSQA